MEDAFASFVSSCLLEPEREVPTNKLPTDEEDHNMVEENIVEFLPFSHDGHLIPLRDRAFSWDVSLENDKVHPDLLLGSVLDLNAHKPVYRPKVFQGRDGHLDDHHENDHGEDHDNLLLDSEGELFGDDLLQGNYGLNHLADGAAPAVQTGKPPRPRIRVTLKAESPGGTGASAGERKATSTKKRTASEAGGRAAGGPLKKESQGGPAASNANGANKPTINVKVKIENVVDNNSTKPLAYSYADMSYPPPPQPMAQAALGVASSSAPGMHMSLSSMAPSLSSLPPTLSTMGSLSMSSLGGPDRRVGAYTIEERRIKIEKFRERKRQRIWRKQIKYDCRKRLADTRPRVKGRFVSRKKMGAGGEDGGGSDEEGEDAAGGNHDEEDGDKDPNSVMVKQETLETLASSFLGNSGGSSLMGYPLMTGSYLAAGQASLGAAASTGAGAMMSVAAGGGFGRPDGGIPVTTTTTTINAVTGMINTYSTIANGVVTPGFAATTGMVGGSLSGAAMGAESSIRMEAEGYHSDIGEAAMSAMMGAMEADHGAYDLHSGSMGYVLSEALSVMDGSAGALAASAAPTAAAAAMAATQ